MNPFEHVRNKGSDEDLQVMLHYTGGRPADKIIAPDGTPYIFRWELAKGAAGGLYFHVQVQSDADRGLHDHPWDNTSTIVSGCYEEIYTDKPEDAYSRPRRRVLLPGSVTHRTAKEAHRLVLPRGVPYCMTLFSMGPHVQSWGFWYDERDNSGTLFASRKFVSFKDATIWDEKNKRSMHKELVK